MAKETVPNFSDYRGCDVTSSLKGLFLHNELQHEVGSRIKSHLHDLCQGILPQQPEKILTQYCLKTVSFN